MQSVTVSFVTVVCSLAYSSALKMEGTCCSETSVRFQRTTNIYALTVDMFPIIRNSNKIKTE
jgi:hypothetical protein